jgi:hypothetical protein
MAMSVVIVTNTPSVAIEELNTVLRLGYVTKLFTESAAHKAWKSQFGDGGIEKLHGAWWRFEGTEKRRPACRTPLKKPSRKRRATP